MLSNSKVKPLLSIIIPVYNAEKNLAAVLDNIAEQTFGDYELLLLDNQSTDSTAGIIKRRGEADSRIVLFSEPDNGIYDAMNKGISRAKGEWIYFMGADDRFYNAEILESLIGAFHSAVDLVYGDSVWMPDNEVEGGLCEPSQLLHRNINHQRVFYRKSLFGKWGDFNTQYRIASDHELNIRFFCNNAIAKKYVPLKIAFYRSDGFSANKTDEVFWQNWKGIFRQNLASHVPSRELYNKLGWYCRYQIDRGAYWKSFLLFWDVFFHTASPGFVLLTLHQFFNRKQHRAG